MATKKQPVAQPPEIPDGVRDASWRLRAICVDEDPEKFFPLMPDAPEVEEIKALCAMCPVRAQCLAFAFVAAEYGTFGGMSQWERDRLLRQYPHLRETA